MFWFDLLLALILALLLSGVLVGPMGWRHPAGPGAFSSALFLFLLLFVAVWAGGIWFSPLAAELWDAYWLPFVLIGLALTLFAAAAAPSKAKKRNEMEDRGMDADEQEIATEAAVFSLFFWLLFFGLALAIVVAYWLGASGSIR